VISSKLTLGPEFTYKKEKYTCQDCEEWGDFALKNDQSFSLAQRGAQAFSMKEMAETLSEKKHVSMAYIERAFELPVGTVARWKQGKFSASSLALMRTVFIYPFLVNVAASGFDSRVAKKTVKRITSKKKTTKRTK